MKYTPIPEDEEFWNHVLWVIPSPILIKRFLPPFYTIYPKVEGGYFVIEIIPF